jgi:hypothetical protein
VHYQLLEFTLLDIEELEEGQTILDNPGRRFLLVERKFGRVGYGPLMADLFSMVTPALRLRAQVVGHKSARRTIYQVQAGVSLEVRRRMIFGWLRDFVNKNPDFNYLRRNVIRKPASKKIRLRPERSRRSIRPFQSRLTAELRRLLLADEPVLEQLDAFDTKVGHLKPAHLHFR